MRRAAVVAALAGAALLCVAGGPPPAVETVFPSGGSVPANLLRVSVRFARPPAGPILPRLTLRGAALAPGQPPFLDQELWTPDGRTLTVLFDPARLKDGVAANLAFGPVLRAGQRIVLALDGVAIKRWRVTDATRAGPAPRDWTIKPPAAGSRGALDVQLGRPIDALDADLIAVAASDGSRVEGRPFLSAGETRWRVVPAEPWRAGAYRVVVSPEIEDAAGNALAQPFESPAGREPPDVPPPAELGFAVR